MLKHHSANFTAREKAFPKTILKHTNGSIWRLLAILAVRAIGILLVRAARSRDLMVQYGEITAGEIAEAQRLAADFVPRIEGDSRTPAHRMPCAENQGGWFVSSSRPKRQNQVHQVCGLVCGRELPVKIWPPRWRPSVFPTSVCRGSRPRCLRTATARKIASLSGAEAKHGTSERQSSGSSCPLNSLQFSRRK